MRIIEGSRYVEERDLNTETLWIQLYCYHMPSSRNIDGNLTLEALDSLEPAINTVLRDRDPRKITLQVGISNYKSFTRFNLRFKRPR